MAVAVVLGALAWPAVGSGQAEPTIRFRVPVDYDTDGIVPAALAAADLNEDGDPDLVAVGPTPAGNDTDGRIAVLVGGKAARFSAATTFPAGTRPLAVALANVVPGAAPDAIVGAVGADGSPTGDGVTVLAGQLSQTGPGFGAPTTHPTGGSQPVAVAAADFDADKHPDLVAANRGSGTVSLLPGGNGAFGPARSLTAGRNPCGLVVADLDGGDRPDIAVSNRGDGTVTVFRAEDGFAHPATYQVGGAPCALSAADVDNDTRPDLVVGDSTAGTVAVLPGRAGGGFAPAGTPTETGTAGVASLVTADFDHDGDVDLAVADRKQDAVAVLPGAGSSTPFQKPVAVPFGTTTAGAAGLVADDVDGDGDTDLVVGRAGSPQLTVLVNNAVPTAVPDRYGTDEDAVNPPLTIPAPGVLENDAPPEPDEKLKANLVNGGGPAHGSVSLGTDGSFTYKPNADFFGDDAFAYTVTDDGGATSAPARVEITVAPVNDAPVAKADSLPVDEDAQSVKVSVTDNDTDVEHDSLTVIGVTPPKGTGTATCSAKACTFEPSPDYFGPATFSYTISDGNGGTDSAPVEITVKPVPDPPVAHDDDRTTPEDTPLTVEVVANDVDADISAEGQGDRLEVVPQTIERTTKGGAVHCQELSCTYVPPLNFSGVDTFPYTVTDSTGKTSKAMVRVTITPQNETPSAADETYGASEDRTLAVNAEQGVLRHARDGDGDHLEAVLVQGTSPGSTLTLQPDGSFTYSPPPEFAGSDSFTYQVYDGKADSATATVTLTVAPVNDPPLAEPQSVTTVDGRAVKVALPVTDPDDDAVTVRVTGAPGRGKVTCAELICTYRPMPHFTGTDSFTYTADDPNGGSASALVTVTVFPAGPRGYWLLGGEGSLYSFGSAPDFGDPPPSLDGSTAVDLEPSPSGNGYWVLDDRGRVHPFGDASAYGSVDPFTLGTGDEARTLVLTATGEGYWVVTAAGRVFPFGDAAALGDLTDRPPPAPIVAATATPNGRGYWMVGSDGEVYAFGSAAAAGSLAGQAVNAPVTSIAADPDGTGYWLASADGGVFAFDAPFRGSMAGTGLNGPVRGIRTYGTGYLLVAEDGGVFVFSDRPFHGSLGEAPPARPVTAGVIF